MDRLIFSATLCASIMLPTFAKADFIGTTTVSFTQQDLGGAIFDGFKIDWSTSLTTGNVTGPDLTDLTVSLTNAGVPVYTDIAIAGSVAQPIAGVARATNQDVRFAFDLTDFTVGLTSFDNDLGFVQSGPTADGVSYFIGVSGLRVRIDQFTDGAGTSRIFSTAPLLPFTQSTTPVPEPSAFLLLVLVFAGVAGWKQVRAHHRAS